VEEGGRGRSYAHLHGEGYYQRGSKDTGKKELLYCFLSQNPDFEEVLQDFTRFTYSYESMYDQCVALQQRLVQPADHGARGGGREYARLAAEQDPSPSPERALRATKAERAHSRLEMRDGTPASVSRTTCRGARRRFRTFANMSVSSSTDAALTKTRPIAPTPSAASSCTSTRKATQSLEECGQLYRTRSCAPTARQSASTGVNTAIGGLWAVVAEVAAVVVEAAVEVIMEATVAAAAVAADTLVAAAGAAAERLSGWSRWRSRRRSKGTIPEGEDFAVWRWTQHKRPGAQQRRVGAASCHRCQEDFLRRQWLQ
jgi:hypothetical protein